MKVPARPLEIDFEQFLKELPIDYPEMAYECHAFTRSRKIKTPAQLLQVVMLYCGMDKALRETAGVFTLLEERVTDTAIHKRLKACAPWVKAFLVPKLCLGMPTLKLRLMSPPHQAVLGHSHSQTGETVKVLNNIMRLKAILYKITKN